MHETAEEMEANRKAFYKKVHETCPREVPQHPPPRTVDGKLFIGSGEDANAFDEHEQQ